MKILEIAEITPSLTEQLIVVWEKSIRATHLFLSEDEIEEIKKYVPQALNNIAHLIIAEETGGSPVAFMGIEKQKLEMLFITPEERGKGLGKRLIQYGIETTQSTNWRSMSRIHLRRVFMSIWAFMFTNRQTMTSKEIHTRFYT